MFPILKHRHLQPELMDDPQLDESSHRHALSGLRRINAWSLTDRVLRKAIWQVARISGTRPLRILDMACGGGDLAIRLANAARQDSIEMEITGWDLSPAAVRFAAEQAATAQISGVHFQTFNALTDPLPARDWDIVMCSLFLHHLTTDDAVRLMQRMNQLSRHRVLIDDLRRTAFGYGLAHLACRVLTRSHVVHADGPMSVAAAFTSEEAVALAARAGFTADILHHWPQRFLMMWHSAEGPC